MATVNLTTTPTQIDDGTAGYLNVINNSAASVRIVRAGANLAATFVIRPGQSQVIYPEGSAVTAATTTGTGTLDVTTTVKQAAGGGGLLYVGSSSAPVTDTATARPITAGPVYWLCGPGVTPTNALDGDLIVNKSA